MKLIKIYTILGVVLGGLLLLFLLFTRPYNKLVTLDESVQAAWSQVENQYQRRADLVPNLVETVKGAADFEQETLTAVVEARASALKTNIDIKDAQDMAEYQQAQSGLSQALSRLLFISENYPQLTATQGFADLRVQLEGTENRISVARKDYNEAVKQYNTYTRQFPSNITAMIFGFDRAALFESNEGADVAPTVSFE